MLEARGGAKTHVSVRAEALPRVEELIIVHLHTYGKRSTFVGQMFYRKGHEKEDAEDGKVMPSRNDWEETRPLSFPRVRINKCCKSHSLSCPWVLIRLAYLLANGAPCAQQPYDLLVWDALGRPLPRDVQRAAAAIVRHIGVGLVKETSRRHVVYVRT